MKTKKYDISHKAINERGSMTIDKSDMYISVIATRNPKPNTLYGWEYELYLEQHEKCKEVLGFYELKGNNFVSIENSLKYHIIPIGIIDRINK